MTTPVYTQQPNQQTDNLTHGGKDVSVAGTAEALSAVSIFTHEIAIQAKRSNAGLIYIGGQNVPNDGSAGFALEPGSDFLISAINLANIYINAVNNGEGVIFVYRS